MKLRITVNGFAYDVEVEVEPEPVPSLVGIGIGNSGAQAVSQPPTHVKAPGSDQRVLRAPIAGVVIRVLARDGDEVAEGQTLLVLEAMKMESEITAPAAGVVERITVSEGESVSGGQVLVQWK